MSPALPRILIASVFAVLLGVPLLMRPASPQQVAAQDASKAAQRDPARLIIITPHNEQIRYEFARGFDEWHQRNYGQSVRVDYNVPGGTSEIRRMLEAQFSAAFAAGRQPGGDADLVFGGGSFEHNRLKTGVRVRKPSDVNASPTLEPISTPVDFSDDWLKTIYGENRIGDDPLYDPDKHWFGLALSGFGIVYNNDLLKELGVQQPRAWTDLCHPKLQGWLALVNPGQSGSVTTAYESILKRHGWHEGWRILRRAGANGRYFSGSSLKPPIDVSHGNAAMGVCIDFYGRFQAQALKEAGDPDRIGYIDPPGSTMLDADPISMLRNPPHPETAQRFIEFCLSDEGQALWQFPKRETKSEVRDQKSEVRETEGPKSPPLTSDPRPLTSDSLGPERFELRRLPIVRRMYAQHFDRFIDKVNPFELAASAKYPDPNFRDFIAPMFAAMTIDTHNELRRAWMAIIAHPAYQPALAAAQSPVVTTEFATDEKLKRMLELFDAFPHIDGPKGQVFSLADVESLGEVRTGWLRGGWADQGLWNAEASPADVMRRRFAAFFRANYLQIVRLAEER